jgi:anionic cell wall polymer biosynthesis LytR-Cps2A-Psr (LCP) family protein
MNGNQVLGYCRVRKVSTGTEHDDFGRTQRQRIVLESIYDKIRSKNVIPQMFLMNDILKKIPIKTDILQGDFKNYLYEASELKVKDIDTYRVPADGSYDNADVQIGSRMQEVLQPKDWDATRQELHTFIYGE